MARLVGIFAERLEVGSEIVPEDLPGDHERCARMTGYPDWRVVTQSRERSFASRRKISM